MPKILSTSKQKVRREWVIVFAVALVFTFLVFRKFFLQGLLPIPSDIVTGLYYPWFDYKWGYATPVPVKNTMPSDVVSIIIPWRLLAFRILKSGQLPLWDPTILLGTPLLANFQASVFNPVNLLFFVMKETTALSLQVVIQPLLVILATYAFLRELKLSKISALFAGLVFAFSNYSVVWLGYVSIDYTLALLPLVLLAVKKIVEKQEFLWSIFLAACICLAIFSGYPLNAAFILGASFIYLSFLVYQKTRFWKTITHFLAGLVLGLGLSAIQLFPSWELYSLSIRNIDLVAQAGNVKYLPLSQIVNFFIPDFFGNPGTWNYWGLGSYDNFAFGIASVAIFFIIIFITSKKVWDINATFFAILSLFTLGFALKNPINTWLSNSNFLGLASGVNTRALFLVAFSGSYFAGRGLDLVLNNKIKFWQKLIGPVFYIFCLVILVGVIYFESTYFNLSFIKTLTRKATSYTSDLDNMIISFRNTLIPSFVIFAMFALSFIKNKKIVILGSFSLLAFITLRTTDRYLSFTKPELFYPQTEITDFLRDNLGNARFAKDRSDLLFPANTWSPYLLKSPVGQNATALMTSASYLSLIDNGRVDNNLITRYTNLKNMTSPLINTLNVQYYLAMNWDSTGSPSPEGISQAWYLPESFSQVSNFKTVRIYNNNANLGPAWFPLHVICERDSKEIQQRIADPYYDPKDIMYVDCVGDDINNESRGTAELTHHNWNDFSFEIDTQAANYMIVSNAYYPGWHAYVDGNKVATAIANTVFIAAPVSAGEHTVSFRYEPKSISLGAIISLFSVIVLFGSYYLLIADKSRPRNKFSVK